MFQHKFIHTMFHIYVRSPESKVLKLTITIPFTASVLSVDQAARFQHQLYEQGVPGKPQKRDRAGVGLATVTLW